MPRSQLDHIVITAPTLAVVAVGDHDLEEPRMQAVAIGPDITKSHDDREDAVLRMPAAHFPGKVRLTGQR